MLTRNEKNEKVPQPIEDEARVDERRAKIGLEPLDEYLKKEGADDSELHELWNDPARGATGYRVPRA